VPSLTPKQDAVLLAFATLLEAAATTPEERERQAKGFRYYAIAEACSGGPAGELWRGLSMSSVERSAIRILTSLRRAGYLVSTTWSYVDPPRSSFERWNLSAKGRVYLGLETA
jgi:hypothetical protein